eukprot:1225459-Prymnesium_polylepis.2
MYRNTATPRSARKAPHERPIMRRAYLASTQKMAVVMTMWPLKTRSPQFFPGQPGFGKIVSSAFG